jgi:hypothetical protein
LEVEDDVELADIAIIFVHLFNVAVHNFERYKLIVGRVAPGDEEERSIAAIDNFAVCSGRSVRSSSSLASWGRVR